ncbi:hypothetical protein ACJ72_02825 [Emergomyces africanus]|uniref:N-acetyltransferase domain-containing protein n=1 Tax=Emergomyces africanus TaxID=1955775 RepID=A0A1B7P1C8_9EURO|nr:hypothetical protein ACJ72_02825 [Emergomyces africanus]
MKVKIRSATASDLPQIHSIFTHYVRNTVITFLTNSPPLSVIAKRLREAQERGLPYLVAVEQLEQDNTETGGDIPEKICGYTQASAFRGYMLSYGPTVEMSLFVHPDYHSQGIGSILLSSLIEALKGAKHRCREFAADVGSEAPAPELMKVKSILAVMAVNPDGKNGGEGLRDWYVQRGFIERGRLKEVGFKHGKW